MITFKKKKSGWKNKFKLYKYVLDRLEEYLIKIQKLKQCKKKDTLKVTNNSFFENEEETKFFLKNWKLTNLEK